MVYLFLKDGFEEMEALVTTDILRRAGIKVLLVGERIVTGSHGIAVQADIPYDAVNLADAEMLVLPGGLRGVNNLWADDRVRKLLTDADARGIKLAAICAAPTILGKLGLLQGKLAVCYPGAGKLAGANTSHGASVVTDGRITTGKAAGTSYAFALELARILTDSATAEKVRAEMYAGEPAPVIRA
jgi:4-methyl-5(b-hydroxyethyl)-thiazole monophosphate biosynthesis